MDIQKLIKESFLQIVSEEYNGFKNYPTFLAASNIMQNKENVDRWSNKAKDIIKTNIENKTLENTTDQLGELMKECYEETVSNTSDEHSELVQFAIQSVDWNDVANRFINEAVDLEKIAQAPDAEYIMVSVKAPGKDDQYGIMVMPRTLKMYFQDPIKLVNAITNERGSYKFVKYIKDHKDPNVTPKPSFMQVFRNFKLETHELNPQHETQGSPEQGSKAPSDTAQTTSPKS